MTLKNSRRNGGTTVNTQLSQRYDASRTEKKWYRFWENEGLFTPSEKSNKPSFSIVIPPPNVTGFLHMGHALNLTLQDILTRYKRMQGMLTLWLPGTDHAGIATQNVVERQLAAEGTSRHELGRDLFLQRVWDWKDTYRKRIVNQLKRMGASCDWSRERFTMDEGLSSAVKEVFIRLFEEGLIYRDTYIVNRCPRCETALADIEVEHREVSSFLYFVRYPIVNRDNRFLVVATTRPETILGDVALAVHPDDERYKGVSKSRVFLPLLEKDVPVITDPYVDMEFGTGVLKITPAHDMFDFELGRKHNLPCLQVIDSKGYMNEQAGDCAGLSRDECREKVLTLLEKKGLLEDTQAFTHSVGHCYRCNTAVEPYVSKQWFVRMKELAAPAIQAVEKGETVFIPERWSKVYYEWMNNIRDWCISRQIWWGHRIPVYYCDACGTTFAHRGSPSECVDCGGTVKQDEDVLDTWFSSALWPFSTLGWPENTRDVQVFYPTSVLVTGFDIIFFWVARMIMMGLKFMGEVPFREIYITPLVRDEAGKKMSKSAGNALDPLEVVERYGADSLRFSLAWLTIQGRDISLSMNHIEAARNFMNKLWNASRFVFMNLEGFVPFPLEKWEESYELKDRWILSRLDTVIHSANMSLAGYAFGDYVRKIYDFVWGDFCDWYIELAKADLYQEGDREKRNRTQNVLVFLLDRILHLLHPVIPYITEEIFTHLPTRKMDSLMVSRWPVERVEFAEDEDGSLMERVQDIIREIRFLRAELSVSPANTCRVNVHFSDSLLTGNVEIFRPYIEQLANCEILVNGKGEKSGMATGRVPGADLFMEVEGFIEVEKEVERLEKKLDGRKKDLFRVRSRLGNPKFLERAPEEVIQRDEVRSRELEREKERLEKLIEGIKGL